ncbi:MAG: tetratricopeptide repeat protein [Planctomycetes bacterium]|nr:tetratricopeptide repeat protein [Planctomycetota bacterium]
MAADPKYDFFISYTKVDEAWARWIDQELKTAGFSTIVQFADFGAGRSFMAQMAEAFDRAERMIAVLSEPYFKSAFATLEWEAAVVRERLLGESRLLPLMVDRFTLPDLYAPIVWRSLFGQSETEARATLLRELRLADDHARVRQPFPGSPSAAPITATVPTAFPGRIFKVPFGRNPLFEGRVSELDEIARRLGGDGRVAISPVEAPGQVEAIAGLGGIGKTQLAVEYAYRHERDYSAVFWLAAENEASLVDSLRRLGRVFGLALEDRPPEDLPEALRRALGQHRGWLLVIDNADEPKLLKALFAGPLGGAVLLTSRERHFPSSILTGGPILLGLWSVEEALDFLRQGCGRVLVAEDERQLEALVEELGRLPLALAQAAAYLREKQAISLEAYRDALSRKKLDLLDRGVDDRYETRTGTGELATVGSTWLLQVEDLGEHHPAAAQLMELCAFLEPEGIPLELFAHLAETGPETALARAIAEDGAEIALAEALGVLERGSLVDFDPGSRTLSIHRLLQEVIRVTLREQRAERAAAAQALVVAAFPSGEPETWPLADRLEGQARPLAERLAREDPPSDRTPLNFMARLAFFLGNRRGDLWGARGLEEAVLAARTRLQGPEHPDTLTSMNNLAQTLRAQGDLEGARGLEEAVLAARTRLQGPEHPDTLTSMNNLALTLQDQGDLEGARGLEEAVLAARTRLLGPEHPDTLTSMNNLALTLQDQGDLEGACGLEEAVLAAPHAAAGSRNIPIPSPA